MQTVPDYGYPRFATRTLAEILRMAVMVKAEACRQIPAASSILVITNDADIAVVNAHTHQVVQCWRQQGFYDVSTYQFDASLKLGHDLIDPSQADQRIEIVYPQLLELVNNHP
jgi:carboxylesterase